MYAVQNGEMIRMGGTSNYMHTYQFKVFAPNSANLFLARIKDYPWDGYTSSKITDSVQVDHEEITLTTILNVLELMELAYKCGVSDDLKCTLIRISDGIDNGDGFNWLRNGQNT